VIGRLYAFNGSNWNPIANDATFTTTTGKPTFMASPSFDLIGVRFQGGRIGDLKPQVLFSLINYNDFTFKLVSSLPEFNISKTTPYFSIGDTHVYLVSIGE
jgi:hypothetical protein